MPLKHEYLSTQLLGRLEYTPYSAQPSPRPVTRQVRQTSGPPVQRRRRRAAGGEARYAGAGHATVARRRHAQPSPRPRTRRARQPSGPPDARARAGERGQGIAARGTREGAGPVRKVPLLEVRPASDRGSSCHQASRPLKHRTTPEVHTDEPTVTGSRPERTAAERRHAPGPPRKSATMTN